MTHKLTHSFLLLLLALLAPLAAACARNDSTPTQQQPTQPASQASTSPAPARTVEASASPAVDDDVRARGTGRFNQYEFRYTRTGARMEAVFPSKKLPYVDTTVVAAARVCIEEAYGEKMENFPRLVAWVYEERQVNAIKLAGNNFDYIFWPLKDDDGQVSTIFFWRVAKDSVK